MILRLRSETKKLLLLIAGFALLIAAISYAIWISNQYQNKSFETAKANLMSKAKDIGVFIETNVNEQLHNFEVISQTSEIIEFSKGHIKHNEVKGFCPLKSIRNTNEGAYTLIALIDTVGNPYHTHFENNINKDSILFMVKKKDLLKIRENHQTIIGECYEGQNGSRLINMMFPVFTEGQFVGAVLVAYNIKDFCTSYFSDLNHQTFPIEISNSTGKLLFNSQPGFPNLRNILEIDFNKIEGISKSQKEENIQLVNQLKKYEQSTGIITFQGSDGETNQIILASNPLKLGDNSYMISVYEDLDKAVGTTYLYTRNIFVVMIVLLIIFILFWVFGWSYLKRFVKIKKETKLLSKISQSENRYWELFNASPIPIIVLSNAGIVSIANKEFLQYLGLKKVGDAYGRDILKLIQFPDEHQIKSLIDMVKRNQNKEKYARMLISFNHPNGQLKTGEFTASEFIFDEKKNILIIINDLTEKNLAENLSLRFGRILNNSHNEIYVLDAHTYKFLHATDGALNHLGYTIDELRQLTPKDITDLDDAGIEQLFKPLQDQTTEQLVFEVVQHKKNGGTYPAEITLQMSHEERPPIFIAILRDLSLEKKAAETIAKERNRSQEYLELAEVMFVVVNKQGNITMINRKGCQILEYQREELIGKPWINTCVPDEAKIAIAQNLNKYFTDTEASVENFESQVVTKHNNFKLISWQHKPILNAEGNVIALLSSGLDITEAKKQEFDLKVSQRQYATLISNLNGIVYRCLYDDKWTMQFISQGVEKITGYLPKELINNSHIAFSDIIHDDDREMVKNMIQDALNKQQSFQLEYRIIKKSGQILWVTEYGQGILEDNKIQHLEGFITDITKIKESEIQLIKLSTAIEQSASSIVITDNNGVIEYVNPYFSDLTGYHKDEVLGEKVSILKSGKMSVEHYEDLWQTITSGQTWHGEFYNKKRNGEFFWEAAVIAPVKNSNNQITSYIAVKQDITQHKQNQADLLKSQTELKISESLFKALSEASFEAIFMSKHGKCIGQNKTAENIFGYTDDEVIDKPDIYWFIDSDKEMVSDRLIGGSAEPYEATAIRKDNSTFPCEIKTRVAEYQGNMVLFTSITNISRRKEAQKNLLESELRYRALIQNNTSVMLLFDPQTGEIVEANKAASAFYGVSEEELKKTCMFDINTLSRQEIAEELKQLRSGNKSYFVFKHNTKHGLKDVELYTGRMDYKDRELYFSVIHDITEKLQVQRELILSKEKAEESDRLKSSFLANMSHEIRTPMNAIIGFSQLLSDDDITPEESASYISIINKSGEQLLELIDDIIKISQIEAGIISIQPEQNNLLKLLQETHSMFSLTVKQKGIQLHLDIPEPGVTDFITDASRFKQILINLLSNAIKFTHKGEVRFGYTIEGGFLKFFVKDTGIGIDKQHYKLIFDRFMQVPHNKKKLYGGTGIGLSISQALVEKMGGTIWLESQLGKGTSFYFTLPNNHTLVSKKEENENDTSVNVIDSLKGKRILIVEDEDSNRQLLELFLDSAQPTILIAENGLDAVELIRQQDVDIILMDIKMPIMNGLEATNEIKKLRPSIPIIIQTAYAMANEREEAFKAGCDAYVAKPVKKNELLKIISKFLN